MVPYDTYRNYQIERAKSPAEIRRADQQAAQLASALSSLFRGLTRPGARGAQAIDGRSAPPAPPGLTSRGLCGKPS